MEALRSAIFTTLSNDATLTANLSTYRGAPAICSNVDIPKDMKTSLVQFFVIADVDSGVKNQAGREVTVQFTCYTSRKEDPTTIAERIRTLLHRSTITITGYQSTIIDVDGPFQGEVTNNYRSLILEATFTIHNT